MELSGASSLKMHDSCESETLKLEQESLLNKNVATKQPISAKQIAIKTEIDIDDGIFETPTGNEEEINARTFSAIDIDDDNIKGVFIKIEREKTPDRQIVSRESISKTDSFLEENLETIKVENIKEEEIWEKNFDENDKDPLKLDDNPIDGIIKFEKETMEIVSEQLIPDNLPDIKREIEVGDGTFQTSAGGSGSCIETIYISESVDPNRSFQKYQKKGEKRKIPFNDDELRKQRNRIINGKKLYSLKIEEQRLKNKLISKQFKNKETILDLKRKKMELEIENGTILYKLQKQKNELEALKSK